MKTGLYYDPIYLKHDTGAHPENAKRLKAIHAYLESQDALKDYDLRAGKRASLKDIALVHSENHIAQVEEAAEAGLPFMGSRDCAMSPETYEVALYAAGAVIDAVVEVAENRLDNAFCAVRPPGHHAEYDLPLGFCFFNNIAIAAEFLIKQHGFKRVLIFDFDVHHGNGTQHFFEERSDVFYASIHQDPRTCFPGTGHSHDIGYGAGSGYTLNCPMLPYSGDSEYFYVFDEQLMPAFQEYKPDFVLISAGFDAHKEDPLASMNLSEDAYRFMTQGMMQIANQYAKGRLVSVLEGGYNLQALSRCVHQHLKVLKEG
ncbi:histone deacetylase [Deltaproteobacteria bacterium TL4]